MTLSLAAAIAVSATTFGGMRAPVEAVRPLCIEARTLDGKAYRLSGRDAITYCIITHDDKNLSRLLSEGHDLQSPYGEGGTFLHFAAHQGTGKAVALLIEHGAAVNARCDGSPSPLDIAVNQGRRDIAEILRRHGAE